MNYKGSKKSTKCEYISTYLNHLASRAIAARGGEVIWAGLTVRGNGRGTCAGALCKKLREDAVRSK
jgi:hypothetical protein